MEAVKAVYQAISGISGISEYVLQSDGSLGIYHDHAPQRPNGDAAATMPYIVFHIENQHCTDVFDKTKNIQEAQLHIEIWIKGRSEIPLSNLRNKLHYHLDRANISYPDNFGNLGIKSMKEIGPLRIQEYWAKHLYFYMAWNENLSGISGI